MTRFWNVCQYEVYQMTGLGNTCFNTIQNFVHSIEQFNTFKIPSFILTDQWKKGFTFIFKWLSKYVSKSSPIFTNFNCLDILKIYGEILKNAISGS